MKRLGLTIVAVAAALAVTSAAHADALSAIKARGSIRVATAIGVPLFAYVDSNLQPTGSDVETAKLIAHDLGVKMDLVQITNAARVPTLQAHKADILVANLAITPDRAKVVDFTIPYANLDIIVAGAKGEKVKNYADLKGKKIGVTRATVNDQLVSEHAKGADIVRFDDDATLITAAASGQVDLVSTQTAVLNAINDKRSSSPFGVKFVQRSLALGIALPKGEPKLKAWLNDWITKEFKSGKLDAVFKKYQRRDLPKNLLTMTN